MQRLQWLMNEGIETFISALIFA